jgi:lysine-N-methylase
MLSCPEAARLVLLNPNPMPASEPSGASAYSSLFRIRACRANGNPHQYLWEIRHFVLLALRDRSYPFWQRLFVLGMFCRVLNELMSTGQLGLVPEAIGRFAQQTAEGSLRAEMERFPSRTAQQLAMVIAVLDRCLTTSDSAHAHLRECMNDFQLGIHYEAGSPAETYAAFYDEARRYYHPFMQQHPHILENYLVNHVLRTRFPFGVNARGEANDPVNEFLVMVLSYAAIRTLLIGMAGHYRQEFSAAQVVKAVQSFSKAVEHNPHCLEGINSELVNAGNLACLLKT